MKKFLGMFVFGMLVFAQLFAQSNPSKDGSTEKTVNNAWTKGVFFDLGFQYNFDDMKPEPEFRAHNLGIELGLGYDFGRLTARLYGNYAFLLAGTAYWDEGVSPILDTLESNKWKFGIEVGGKVIDTAMFDLTIPLGLLFNWTEYKQKNPSYTDPPDPVAYDRYWKYNYINIYSGVDISIKCSEHIKIMIMPHIGLPIFKEYKYEEVLRGDYIWTETGTNTYSEKPNNIEILAFSVGLGIRLNL
jgi:hypothetical protein